VADAIGRTIPFLVLEDRDFRDEREVDERSKRMKKDRSERNLAILEWRCWRRNEIENYFLDDDVILPVFEKEFGCTVDQVKSAVDKAVGSLAPFQALQAAFHKTRGVWEDSDPSSLLAPSRPSWNANGLEPVDATKLRNDVEARLDKWRAKVVKHGDVLEPWKGETFLAEFDQRIADWANLTSDSPNWREVWAGKEVLKLVRQQLCAGNAGWWSVDPEKPSPVAWHAMKNNRERDAHDREIERALLPALVNRFVDIVTTDQEDLRRAEFDEMAAILSA
jgi:hypothetical protein